MPTVLTDLDIDEVSLVDDPANEGARLILWKAAGMKTWSRNGKKYWMKGGRVHSEDGKSWSMEEWEKSMGRSWAGKSKNPVTNAATAILAKTEMTDEQLDAAEAEIDAAVAETTVQAEPETSTDDAGSSASTSEAGGDGIEKAAMMTELEDLRQHLAKAKETSERLAKAESEIAEFKTRERVAKAAAELAQCGVHDAEAMAGLLDQMDGEVARAMAVRLMRDAKLVKAAESRLFHPAGSDAAKPDSAEAEIMSRAQAIVEKGGAKSIPEAVSLVRKNDVELRRRYDAERGRG